LDHQIHGSVERAAAEPGRRVEDAEGEQLVRLAATDVGAVVVVGADVVEVLVHELPGVHVDQRGEDESLVYPALIKAPYDPLRAFVRPRAGQVRVSIEDLHSPSPTRQVLAGAARYSPSEHASQCSV